jgi:hypothetical protein
MPFLTRRALVLAKIESTYGTDPVPAAATDAILVNNLQIRIDAQLLTREFLRANLSRLSAVVGKKTVQIDFETEIKGSGAAGTAARHGVLHRACGMSETIVAVTSVTYAPISTGFESVTIYAYMDGIVHKISGCYGTFKISEKVGEFGKFMWSFKGLYVAPIDAAIAGGAVFDTTKPQMIQSLGLTLGGYQVIASALELDMGVEVSERLDLNSAEGLKALQVTNRAVGGSIDPEAVAEATHAFWAAFKNATEEALAGNLIGAVAGNKVAITAPKVQYEAPGWADRSGNRIYNIPIRLNPSTDAAQDEISIAYT